jgi:2-oxoacid:acceptor oxidoreductase gamma subunit (pyruvate/2-ketoisovalerate family)
VTELTIFGRGGQGGVTLAKLIAAMFFRRDQYVQAFGVYAAERSGAPVQAYVRIDDQEITLHNQIRTPDHIIVLDPTLLGAHMLSGLKPGGWIIINTPEPPIAFETLFPGRQVATLDATEIAVRHQLGTRSVPIVNTTMLGAVASVLGLTVDDALTGLSEVGFGGANADALRDAFDEVQRAMLAGEPVMPTATPARPPRIDVTEEFALGAPTELHTGTWASRRPQRKGLTPPCNHNCPAGNDVQGFIAALNDNDVTKALETILETSPFPGICGRVCPAPCQDGCNRAEFDAPVNTRELERYAAERGRWPVPPKPHRKTPIAVVGSGPAGLTAVYHLTRLGYPVELFEAGNEFGGVMRTGIPGYRLPRDVLDREISNILRGGVTAHMLVHVDRPKLLELSQQFSAVFVATGLQQMRGLDLGEQARGLAQQGLLFLDLAREHKVSCRGERVVVVGGGNTAMDAARSALRLGAREVNVVYRRTRAEMPAIREEIDEGLAEGIRLHELVLPLTLRRNGDEGLLVCQRMELGPADESGRPRPQPLVGEDAQFELPCDRVLLALGQSHDLSILPEGAEIQSADGALTHGLAAAPVFVGGDLATNDGTVAHAIGQGHHAALHIHRTLTGEDLFPPSEAPLAGPETVTTHVFTHAPRQTGGEVAPQLRRHTFSEVRQGLTDRAGEDQVRREAARCFSCGVCNECDRCLVYCPEGVLVHRGNDYEFDYDYCKGCGVCASQCPRGVVFMAQL